MPEHNAGAIAGALRSRQQLNACLSRSITMMDACYSDCLEDDLRFLQATGAKFVGRAAYAWFYRESDEKHFKRAGDYARRVHNEVDEDVVLQAGIFEAVYPQVDQIPIPGWVFEDFQQKTESRNFSFQKITGSMKAPSQGLGGQPWKEVGVPDLSGTEAMMWFYYRARRYLQSGYEALHLGQIHLVGGFDRGYETVNRLVNLIRIAADKYARRSWVLLDAHSHGICKHGKLLFDFTSRPASSRPLLIHPEKVALIKRGEALGGTHPGGWECKYSPVLVEIDNWGGYSLHPEAPEWNDLYVRSGAGKWGYDDIAWFARLKHEERKDFLQYAYRWCQLQGEEWHFQMPAARPLTKAVINDPEAGKVDFYRANLRSEACLTGFGDEPAVSRIWSENLVRDHRVNENAGVAQTGSGLTVPQPVTVGGSLQTILGGIPGDASCAWTQLFSQGNGFFKRVFCVPVAGTFSLIITCGGTQTDPVGRGGIAGGGAFKVSIPKAGFLIIIGFDYETKRVTVTDIKGQTLLPQ